MSNPKACVEFLSRLTSLHSEGIKHFSSELVNHFRSIKETDKIRRDKLKLWKLLRQVICPVSSRARLFGVGSLVNGLATQSSDIDLCLIDRAAKLPKDDKGPISQDKLSHIRGNLAMARRNGQIPVFSNFINIRWATVPIVKFNMAGYSIDIQSNRQLAIRGSYLLHHYVKLDDRFRILAIVIKTWAKSAGISNPQRGLLGSYALTLMLIHYLQVGAEPPVLPNLFKLYPYHFSTDVSVFDIWEQDSKTVQLPSNWLKNNQSLAELLAGFFAYFSWQFNAAEQAISVKHGCVKRSGDITFEKFKYGHSPILMDDFYGDTNVTRSVRFEHMHAIQHVFDTVTNLIDDEGFSERVLNIITGVDTNYSIPVVSDEKKKKPSLGKSPEGVNPNELLFQEEHKLKVKEIFDFEVGPIEDKPIADEKSLQGENDIPEKSFDDVLDSLVQPKKKKRRRK